MYRVVWADSRAENVSYDGKIHEIQLYADNAAGKWVLEKWLPAAKYAGSRETHERNCRANDVWMEYPSRGDYFLSAIFPGEVIPSLAHLWASAINHDQANHTPAERARALREAYALSQKQTGEKKDQIIQNLLERTPDA
jgi:hypothetical protein